MIRIGVRTYVRKAHTFPHCYPYYLHSYQWNWSYVSNDKFQTIFMKINAVHNLQTKKWWTQFQWLLIIWIYRLNEEKKTTKLHKNYWKFDFDDSHKVFFVLQNVVTIQMQASRLHFGRHDAFSLISNDKIFHSTTERIFDQFVDVFSTLVCTFEPKLTFDWPILTENVCIFE